MTAVDAVVPRRRRHVVRRRNAIAFGPEHQHRHAVALGQLPVQPQRQVEQRARRFGAEMARRLGQDLRRHVVAEIVRTKRVEDVARQPRRVEVHHRQQVIGPLGREPRGDRQQSGRRHGGEQRRGAHRPRREQALDHRRAHRMPDQHRRRRQLRDRALDVGGVVVEPGDEQHLGAGGRAVPAQADRVGRIALPREPRQEERVPAPAVAVAAVHEQQRRLAAVGTAGEARAELELRFGGKHRRDGWPGEVVRNAPPAETRRGTRGRTAIGRRAC